jgi:hypothetical protein
MLERLWAERFGREWTANWNSKNLDAIISHYDQKSVSRISVVLGKQQKFVSGLAELCAYWSKALAQVKELRFSITNIGIGDALLYDPSR